jgi:hypothetical protein
MSLDSCQGRQKEAYHRHFSHPEGTLAEPPGAHAELVVMASFLGRRLVAFEHCQHCRLLVTSTSSSFIQLALALKYHLYESLEIPCF